MPDSASSLVSMHLLVLSAFRHADIPAVMHRANGLNAPFGAQCFPTGYHDYLFCIVSSTSQCTFWCSVLSDVRVNASQRPPHPGLNAPFGAQCFPTDIASPSASAKAQVSMHLLVLSAFRQEARQASPTPASKSQCTFWCSVLSDLWEEDVDGNWWLVSMHLLVLSAFRHESRPTPTLGVLSQCTFWCSVLSDSTSKNALHSYGKTHVSMHLLVLSAFRRGVLRRRGRRFARLNAPFGAQCFPTRQGRGRWRRSQSLNAPFGAQCFPTGRPPPRG